LWRLWYPIRWLSWGLSWAQPRRQSTASTDCQYSPQNLHRKNDISTEPIPASRRRTHDALMAEYQQP
jgi:hypothetical protein